MFFVVDTDLQEQKKLFVNEYMCMMSKWTLLSKFHIIFPPVAVFLVRYCADANICSCFIFKNFLLLMCCAYTYISQVFISINQALRLPLYVTYLSAELALIRDLEMTAYTEKLVCYIAQLCAASFPIIYSIY